MNLKEKTSLIIQLVSKGYPDICHFTSDKVIKELANRLNLPPILNVSKK